MYNNTLIQTKENNKMFTNKTLKYLIPYFIKSKPIKFQNTFNKFKWISFGIGDTFYTKEVDDLIFCLVNVNYNFSKYYEYITELDFYEDDYIFNTDSHMFVFKLEEGLVNKFINGQYSKMYSLDDIENYFVKTFRRNKVEHYTDSYGVLVQSEYQKNKFKNTLINDFGITVKIDMEDKELDYPPVLQSEIYNYEK